MRSEENTNIEHAGQDSFLDVTTNIVGVLIILVMVVGMRAQNPIVKASPAPTSTELEAIAKQAANIEYDVRRMGEEIRSIDEESAAKDERRGTLATLIAAAQKHVGDQRAKLDASKQEDFDLRRQVVATRALVDRDEGDLKNLESQKAPTVEVKHYPTPISRTVMGHEVHFQLLGGRITYVPMDEFAEDMRADLRGSDLSLANGKSGVVGPRQGFECHYDLQIIMDRRSGAVSQVNGAFHFIPVGVQAGEPVDRALGPQSEFRRALARHSPHDTTVTLWTYPDSFAVFQQLKEELHKMGYATAGRPMFEGSFIGGSSNGSRSSAE